METKAGKTTSEHAFSWAALFSSILIPTLAVLVERIQGSGFVDNGIMLTVLSMIGTVLASLGYVGSRTLVKLGDRKAATALELRRLELAAGPAKM